MLRYFAPVDFLPRVRQQVGCWPRVQLGQIPLLAHLPERVGVGPEVYVDAVVRVDVVFGCQFERCSVAAFIVGEPEVDCPCRIVGPALIGGHCLLLIGRVVLSISQWSRVVGSGCAHDAEIVDRPAGARVVERLGRSRAAFRRVRVEVVPGSDGDGDREPDSEHETDRAHDEPRRARLPAHCHSSLPSTIGRTYAPNHSSGSSSAGTTFTNWGCAIARSYSARSAARASAWVSVTTVST